MLKLTGKSGIFDSAPDYNGNCFAPGLMDDVTRNLVGTPVRNKAGQLVGSVTSYRVEGPELSLDVAVLPQDEDFYLDVLERVAPLYLSMSVTATQEQFTMEPRGGDITGKCIVQGGVLNHVRLLPVPQDPRIHPVTVTLRDPKPVKFQTNLINGDPFFSPGWNAAPAPKPHLSLVPPTDWMVEYNPLQVKIIRALLADPGGVDRMILTRRVGNPDHMVFAEMAQFVKEGFRMEGTRYKVKYEPFSGYVTEVVRGNS